MTNKSKAKLPTAVLLIGALITLSCPAAVISWGPATDTTGKFQFIEGNLVIALNGGSNAPNVIGGGTSGTSNYPFTATNYAGVAPHTFVATGGDAGDPPRNRVQDNVYAPSSITSTGHLQFDNMISSVTDANGTPSGIVTGTLTLVGLNTGTDYQIQVFFNDQRATSDDRVMSYGDGNGNTVNLAGGNPADGVQTSAYGQNAIGAFTASGSNQVLTMTANGFGNIHFNAILVAEVVPEPTSATLLGLAGLGLLARRRRWALLCFSSANQASPLRDGFTIPDIPTQLP